MTTLKAWGNVAMRGPTLDLLLRRLLQTFCFLLVVCGSSGRLCGQTAWTIHPDSPSNLTSIAKLKYANNSFRLVWQSTPTYPTSFFMTDFKEGNEIAMPFSLTVSNQSMGVDPAPGFSKKLTLRYATASGQYQAVVQDGFTLNIPSSSHQLVGPGQAVTGFVVLSATYGTTTTFADVKSVFRIRNLPFNSYASIITTLNDFIYDGAGSLLLLEGGYNPSLAYPQQYNGTYRIEAIGGGNYSSSVKACGAYGNGKLVVGFSDTSYSPYDELESLIHVSSPGNYSYYSWTAPALAPGFQVKQIIFENGKFVAVGSRHDFNYPYSSKGAVMVSVDGVEWTTVVIPGTKALESVCRDAAQWVAVGDAGAVLTSPNGFEWTKTIVPGAGDLVSVACANGYCAVGSSSGRIYTSNNFSSWSFQIGATGSVSCLAVGDGKFMALVGTKVYQAPFSPVGIADIVAQPVGSFTVPQQSVALSVEAVGGAPVSFQWYEGASGDISQPVNGATDSNYQTPPLAVTRSYWVRVTNGIGSEDSTTATLTMQAPPVITSQPVSKTLAMGASVSTSVTVTGNNISYQWYQGFSGDVSKPLAGNALASLTLPSQVPGVSFYWVRVSNAMGALDSAAMRADVTSVAPVIVDQPLDKSTYPSGYQSISVKANGPYLNYQWYGGVSGDTSHPMPDNYASFSPPDSFAGIYQFWVRVSNSVGFVDSRTVIFTVLNPAVPVIVRQPDDTATYVGSSKSINIDARGDDLKYAWYAGESGVTSVLMPDFGSYLYPSYALPGTYRYWVRVSNQFGFVDSVAVTYVVKPLGTGLISKHPVNTSTQVNTSISLSVTAAGSGLSYQWYAGVSGDTSTLLSGATSTSFSPPVGAAGQQSYWVRVTSGILVEDSETAVVKVISRILAITDPPMDQSAYVGDSFYYYVYTNGSNVTYQWYAGVSGDTSLPLANETSYSFDPPVTVAGVFRYWMRATSGVEHVDSRTVTVTVIGQQPVFTTQPQNQLLSQGTGSVSLSAVLDNTTGVAWQWYQGTSGNTSVPLSGKTGSSLGISNPLAGTYSYWVRATNPFGIADSRTATVIVTPVLYSDWLVQNGLPANASGLGAPGASSNQDGVANLLKYLLGMRANDRFDASHGPQAGTRNIGGDNYFTLGFIQSKSAQNAQLVVQESTNLGSWTATAIECGPSYDNGDGTMTRTFRCSQPMGYGGNGYLRLKATSN